MKLNGIKDYLNMKKVRRDAWCKNRYIYFDKWCWFDDENNLFLSVNDIGERLDWEEYIEEKPKKKYAMYRYWFLDEDDELSFILDARRWEESEYHSKHYKLLETEIIKELLI